MGECQHATAPGTVAAMEEPRRDPLADFLADNRSAPAVPPPAPSRASPDGGAVDADVEAAEAELDAYHDELAAAEMHARVETSDPGWDASFAATLDPETAHFGEATHTQPTCQWCHAELPVADAARCPTCGAILQPLDMDADVPGVTSVSGQMRAELEMVEYRRRLAHAQGREAGPPDVELLARRPTPPQELFGGKEPPESYAPPSDDVRKEMRKILLEAIEADPDSFVEPGPLSEAPPGG
jgi:hypothetical protein